ncbi:MAG: hypothetical protein WCY29_18145 [Novosphingobium sp.]
MARDNIYLADRIGQGIAQLFAPPDNSQRMKYLIGASQVAQNNAQIDKLGSETALNTQTHTNRGRLNNQEALLAAGLPPEIVGMVGSALGLSKDAGDGIGALFQSIGRGQMMNPNATEGQMRRAGAIAGDSAAGLNSPLTEGGIADLFEQAQTIQGMKDDAARYGHDASAAARRYAADQSAAATRYGHDTRLFNVTPGATLVDRSGKPVAQGAPKPGANAPNADGIAPLKPSDAVAIQRLIDIQAAGRELPPQLANAIAARVAQTLPEYGNNAQAAVSAAFSELAEGVEATPGVPTRVPFRDPIAPTPARLRARVNVIDPSAPGTMPTPPAPPPAGLTPDILELLDLYGGQ